MEQRTVTNDPAGKRPEYRTMENIISDKTKAMASFIKYNEDKRLGLDRRQFSYDKHIPERRSGQDRRTNLIEDQNQENQNNRYILKDQCPPQR